LLLAVGMAAVGSAGGAANVALGKNVTFNIPPNYWLCRDEGDAVQLTDGKTLDNFAGYAWTDKQCVGWTMLDKLGLVQVVVDLEKDTPISGFSWNLSFGCSGVSFPGMIDVYVSVDGRSWHAAGQLLAKALALRPMPPPNRYTTYRVRHEDMPCHGRYVAFLVEQKPFCFVDEVEVYRGDDKLLGRPNPGVAITEPIRFHRTGKFRTLLEAEAERAQAPQSVRRKIATVDFEAVREARMELPYPAVRREIWASNVARLRAAGFLRPALWTNNRWENLDPLTIPQKESLADGPIVIDMMRGEVRAETVNVLNPTDQELDCTFSVEGLGDDSAIVCHEVVFTDTKNYRTVSAALRAGDGPTVSFKMPAGVSRQVWISSSRPKGAAGTRRGRAIARLSTGETLKRDFCLRVRNLDFPERRMMHVGGWDYLDRDGDYYRTASAYDATRRFHREIGLDIAWGTTAVKPSNPKFDAAGALVAGPDFSRWDRWTKEQCPDAKVYAAFMDVGGDFHGETAGTPRFDRMLGDYLRAWEGHAKDNGLGDRKILLLLMDEPYEPSLAEQLIKWMRPIRQAKLKNVKVFEDIHFQEPWDIPDEFWNLCDIVSPQTDQVRDPRRFAFYRSLVEKGEVELWLYSANGPSRSFDPISYYRMQAWTAFALGAKESGSQFWAFGCGGGIGNSWTPYCQTGVEYSPYFVSPEGPSDSKQCEGAREGMEDFECLTLYAEKFGSEKLKKVMDRVMASLPYGDPDWDAPGRDHGLLDRVRVELLNRLEGTVE